MLIASKFLLNIDPPKVGRQIFMGWMKGLEPITLGATDRYSTFELQPPIRNLNLLHHLICLFKK